MAPAHSLFPLKILDANQVLFQSCGKSIERKRYKKAWNFRQNSNACCEFPVRIFSLL